MILIDLFFYFLFFSIEVNNDGNLPNKQIYASSTTDFSELTHFSNFSKDDIEFVVFNTSYTNQLVITSHSLSFFNASHYSFKPMNDMETEYIYIENEEINNYDYNLSFDSIFVTFSSQNLYIKNLSLFDSPIRSKKEKISLTVDYLKSDFYSLPQTTVSSVNIKKEFIFLEETSETSNENHAKIYLSSNAKQIFSQTSTKHKKHKFIEKAKFINNQISIENLIGTSDFINNQIISEDFENQERQSIEKVDFLNNQINIENPKHKKPQNKEKVELSNNENSEHTKQQSIEKVDSLNGQINSENFKSKSAKSSSSPFDDSTTDPSENKTEPVDFFLNTSLTILTLHNDRVEALFENQENETLLANSTFHLNIYTNTTGLTVRYEGDAYFLTSLKLNLYLTVECIIIFDQSWRILGGQILSNVVFYHSLSSALILMTDLDEVPYVTVMPAFNVRYFPERPTTESYCLCTKTRLEECIANKECFLYSVPLDHYYSSSNSLVSDIVADSKPININIYLTYTSFNDYHQFTIKPIVRSRKNLNFISVAAPYEVNLAIFDLSQKKDINKVIVNCVDLSNVYVSLMYENSVDTIMLRNSPFNVQRPLRIRNFVTDAFSLNRLQSETVFVSECLSVNRSEMNSIGIKFMLLNNATLEIQQISMFPTISITQSQISFSANEDEFSVGFDGGCYVKISERSTDNPTVSITSNVPLSTNLQIILDFILDNSMIIDFSNALPFPNGMLINFVPSSTKLTSLELIMSNDIGYNSDSYSFFPFGNISGNIDLILSSPGTVRTFMNCLIHNDFTVSNLSHISMNFNANLKGVTFYDESIVAKVTDGIGYFLELKFDRLFITGQMTIISNSSETIEMSLNYSDFLNASSSEDPDFGTAKPGLISKMQDFVLKSTNEASSIFFDETFSAFMNNSVLSKIKIDHGTKNIELKTNLSTVPKIEVIDDVSGVLYYANLETINLTHSYNSTNLDKYKDFYGLFNYRSGPNLTIYVLKSDIFVHQNQFLAENVTFIGDKFVFLSKGKSRCKYNFVNVSSLLIVPSKISISITEKSSEKVNISSNEFANYPYFNSYFEIILELVYRDYDVDYSQFTLFFCTRIATFQKSAVNFHFTEGNTALFFSERLKSDIESLTKVRSNVTVATNVFTVVDRDLHRAIIDNDSLSIAKDPSSKSVYETPFVKASIFIVDHTSDDDLEVSLASKNISSNFFFIMESASRVFVHLDNSWYLAKNAENVIFVILNSREKNETSNVTVDNGYLADVDVTIKTDLYEMPNIRVVDSSFDEIPFTGIVYDPVLDSRLSFIIFISLAGATVLISVVFLGINVFCIEKFTIEDDQTAKELTSNSGKPPNKKLQKNKPKIKRRPSSVENFSSADENFSTTTVDREFGEMTQKEANNGEIEKENNESKFKNIQLARRSSIGDGIGGTSLSIAIEDSF